ncbi:MAG: discoidin domain-containing protein, partial [Tannerellaceae bacterium]
YFYNPSPNLNKFATAGSEFATVEIKKNPQVMVKLAAADITAAPTVVTVEGFEFAPADTHRVKTGALSAPQQAVVTEENTEAYTMKPTWAKVDNADYYEIEFNNMLYSTIKDTELLFEDLQAETPYTFKVRAVNKDGVSDWTTFNATTKSNPLEFAIKGITAQTSAANQGGQGVNKLFDFDESNTWHTKWSTKAVPFEMIVDLNTINQLDKFHYLPRGERGNGILKKGTVSYSMDRENWTDAGAFDWAADTEEKVFTFKGNPTVRYIKLNVTEAVGDYGSGREMYVFKVPGTESYIPGDINNDRLINRNDLTSYMNYTGLRRGDADFEGYISNGDLNKNDLIDAYDISVVATRCDGGAAKDSIGKVAGTLQISTPKKAYNAGDVVEILVKGTDLQSVNALSFALPYNPQDYEFVTVEPIGIKAMENLTNDRLHTNGTKALYPTFVNVGKKEALEGTADLFVLKLKARRNVKFDLKPIDGYLVDKDLNYVTF